MTSPFLAAILLFVQEIDRLKRRLEEVERELGEQHEVTQSLRSDVERLAALVEGRDPAVAKPNPGELRRKETPAERRARNQELARRARAAKQVGTGKGKVSKAAKKRMRADDRKRGG